MSRKIAWVHSHHLNRNVASARVNMMLPSEQLQLDYPDWVQRFFGSAEEALAFEPDVLIAISTDKAQTALAKRRPASRTSIVAFQSDGPQLTPVECAQADAIVTDSQLLTTRIPLKFADKMWYIADTLEKEVEPASAHTHPGRPLRSVWVGAGANFFFAEPIIRPLLAKGWAIELVGDGPVATTPWSLETLADVLQKADVGLVPYPIDLRLEDSRTFVNWLYKDDSRVRLLQAAGLPVIASPHPAHLLSIYHHRSGLLANSLNEWEDCLEALQQDELLYDTLARRGKVHARQTASAAVTARQWSDVISYAASRIHPRG